MSFLLDTNICSAHLKRAAGLTHFFVQHSGRLYVPTLVIGELYTWAHHRQSGQSLVQRIEHELLNDVTILDFDRKCAIEFGRVNGRLLRQGIVENHQCAWIAA
jgi:tRNA(fMet)-specific endonuclease VapC